MPAGCAAAPESVLRFCTVAVAVFHDRFLERPRLLAAGVLFSRLNGGVTERQPGGHTVWSSNRIQLGERHGTGNRQVVQQRKGLRLHRSGRRRPGRLRPLLGDRQPRATAASTRTSASSSRPPRARRARRRRTSARCKPSTRPQGRTRIGCGPAVVSPGAAGLVAQARRDQGSPPGGRTPQTSPRPGHSQGGPVPPGRPSCCTACDQRKSLYPKSSSATAWPPPWPKP